VALEGRVRASCPPKVFDEFESLTLSQPFTTSTIVETVPEKAYVALRPVWLEGSA